MRWTVPLSLLAAAAASAAAGAGPAAASTPPAPVAGHVYVNDNTATTNTIAAFDRHADGTLTPVPGSPFPTGGAGLGTITGSQGALQETQDGRYLLAVDAGSNQISVLQIGPGGGLTDVDTVGSGGAEPVSIAVHGNLVFVANDGSDGSGSDYAGFWFSGGRLWRLPWATYALPGDAQPGDVLFNGTGRDLVGTRVGTSQIDSFTVGWGGRLTPAPGSPFTAQGSGPFGSEFRPTDPNQLFVSNAHNGGSGTGTVSAFSVGPEGALQSIGSSPFADDQTAPCWVEISHDGRFLFAVNTAVATISSYLIAPSGALTLLPGYTQMRGGSADGPFDARLSPDGSTLWVVDSHADAVSGFDVSGGSLSEIASSPTALPAGATPFGIVVN